MSRPNATVQAGSGIIGDAAGTTVIVEADAADQFGEGATLIVWPSGQNLDPGISNYETMLVESKSGATLTVVRGTEEDPTGLSTFAAGDQVALSFPEAARLARTQTQVITVGKTPGNGPTLDLGADSFGIVGLITATIKDVNLDGGTPGNPFGPGDFAIGITVGGSFDGVNWDPNPSVASGTYANPTASLGNFLFDDPAPLYAQFFSARYLRFPYEWDYPTDIGVNASATVIFELDYF